MKKEHIQTDNMKETLKGLRDKNEGISKEEDDMKEERRKRKTNRGTNKEGDSMEENGRKREKE